MGAGGCGPSGRPSGSRCLVLLVCGRGPLLAASITDGPTTVLSAPVVQWVLNCGAAPDLFFLSHLCHVGFGYDTH